ncbi:MAG: hypothetical protein HYV27_14230 [Candidatus Hydrogenedentes bacterium]|nr:hypothetical protein [Candidatus Hydrogenedentota bacterium]
MPMIQCAYALQDVPVLRLAPELAAIASAGISHWHVDIADGVFVPWFGCGENLLRELAAVSPLPCHVHLLAQAPERHVERLAQAGAAGITVHVESAVHAHRVLNQIRNAGASPGIALAPTTPLTKLEYLLPEVDRVLVCTRDLDRSTGNMVVSGPERVKILNELIHYSEYSTVIEVEGIMNARNAAQLHHFGARSLVLDAHSLPFNELNRESVAAFINALLAESKTI